MNNFLAGLVVPGVFLGFVVLGVGVVTLIRKGLPWERKRKSPFSGQFLRTTGDSIFKQLEELRLDVFSYLFGLAFIPIYIIATYLLQQEITGKHLTDRTIFIVATIVVVAIIRVIFLLVRTTRKAQRMQLGYEAEVAVGQELNQLMVGGFRVYHDFPAEGFNIDHIVIGRTGVFAVETKGRSKPDTGDGRADARVVYDGASLIFPHWKETKPIEQARMQSKWLSRWLTSAVGESVNVIPVVAIPGWFIESKGRSDVLVFFGKNPETLFAKYSNGTQLSDQMIQRIAHQVESKCRDIESKVYGSNEMKNA